MCEKALYCGPYKTSSMPNAYPWVLKAIGLCICHTLTLHTVAFLQLEAPRICVCGIEYLSHFYKRISFGINLGIYLYGLRFMPMLAHSTQSIL